MLTQTYRDTAYLLRRAGFGDSAEGIQAASQRSLDDLTDELLHPERTPDTFDDDGVLRALMAYLPEQRHVTKQGRDFLPLQVVKMWWTMKMLSTPHPLVEKMTLFWHGHFTSKDGNRQGTLMLRQNQLFREHALGNFRDLTLAVARNPEMLRYLDGNKNFKAHANENFGRELMEIYTCGIGHYTEEDVRASSRAFTGWNMRGGRFYFNAAEHDNGQKTFMGQTGNWNGDDIIDMLVAHPATAKRLCTQLFTQFAYPNPEPAVVDALTATYYSSGYDVRAIMNQILPRSHAFYSDKARNAVIKCPVQYVIGSVKMLGLNKNMPSTAEDVTAMSEARPPLGGLPALPLAMATMGQDILEPPSVKGWDGGTRWINTATMLARVDFANTLSQTRHAFDGQFASAVDYVQQNNLTPDKWIDYLAVQLGPLQLAPETRQMLIEYVSSEGEFTPVKVPPIVAVSQETKGPEARFRPQFEPGGLEGRLRGVIPLIMATPEYQVC